MPPEMMFQEFFEFSDNSKSSVSYIEMIDQTEIISCHAGNKILKSGSKRRIAAAELMMYCL
jgi:hypothetical protein